MPTEPDSSPPAADRWTDREGSGDEDGDRTDPTSSYTECHPADHTEGDRTEARLLADGGGPSDPGENGEPTTGKNDEPTDDEQGAGGAADGASNAGEHRHDVRIEGTGKSVDVGDIEYGIEVAGERTSIAGSLAGDPVRVTITGDHNSLKLHGSDCEVILVHEGRHNSLTVSPDVDVTHERDTGSHFSVSRDERFSRSAGPATDLIQRTRSEACSELGLFGVSSITYQTDASDQSMCRYCGREASQIVHRHSEKVLRVLGLTITLEEGGSSDECRYCTLSVDIDDVELSEEEKRAIYR